MRFTQRAQSAQRIGLGPCLRRDDMDEVDRIDSQGPTRRERKVEADMVEAIERLREERARQLGRLEGIDAVLRIMEGTDAYIQDTMRGNSELRNPPGLLGFALPGGNVDQAITPTPTLPPQGGGSRRGSREGEGQPQGVGQPRGVAPTGRRAKAGRQKGGWSRRYTPEQEEAIRKGFDAGKSGQAVAKELGLAVSAIAKRFRGFRDEGEGKKKVKR